MNGPRAKVRLHNDTWGRGTVLDPQGEHGPSRILVDATYPSRLVEPSDWTFVFRCVFDRIGRSHDVAPLEVEARTADTVAEEIYRYARRFLGSSEPVVSVDLEAGRGLILCGFRPGGTFTVEAIEPVIEVARA